MFNPFSKTEIDDGEEIKKTIALLKPQTDRLLLEADAERVQQQKSKLLQLDSLAQQRNAEIPSRQAEVQQLSEKEEKLRAALEVTEKARSRAASELALRQHWYDHQTDLLWSAIRDLAPAAITERQRKWRELVEETRLKIDAEERHTQPNVFGRWNRIFISNSAIIKKRVDVISAAINAAEEMKLEPLGEAEAIQKLDAMQKQFPPFTNDRETTAIPGPDVSELRRASW
jgi:hypothetical protein